MATASYGIIGLGRMGAGLVRNLRSAGLLAAVYDRDREAVAALVAEGAQGTTSLPELVGALAAPRVIWMMVPAGAPVDEVLAELTPHLAPGDVVIDGGNSFYKDSIRRAAAMAERGIGYLDCGTSGGLEGARNGLCLMIGGEQQPFAQAEPLFRAIAQQDGYAHVGPSGAGHFVKMVHNAIEYGMLQAIGEGFELLEAGPYSVDHEQIARLWNNGSVIRSWLIELTARAFANDPDLRQITGEIGGGSTGSWAIQEGWEAGVPMPAIAAAYSFRLRSRQEESFTGKVIASLRNQFGGHAVRPR